MEKQELEVFSSASNAAIIRHPGRRFPGLLVQGDTLNGLRNDVRYLAELIGETNEEEDEELHYTLLILREKLDGMLAHYEAVLKAHGIQRPY